MFSDILDSFMIFFQWCIYMCMYMCMWEYVSTISFKRCFQFRSNLVCILQVINGRTLLISVNDGCTVFCKGVQKEFLYITAREDRFFNVFEYQKGAFDHAQIWYAYYRSPSHLLYLFCEFRIVLSRKRMRNCYALQSMESNFKKDACE